MPRINVQDTDITILSISDHDFISLTDMASAKGGDSQAADIIKNWIRNRYTIEFLGTWEIIHNPNFKVVEFDHFKMTAKEWRDTHPEARPPQNTQSDSYRSDENSG